jgi:hypothetical protein
LLGAALSFGACSTLDGGDVDHFEEAMKELSVEDRLSLKKGALADKTKRYLQGRDLDERAIRSECRYKKSAGDEWGAWRINITIELTNRELLDCFGRGHSYAECLAAGVYTILKETIPTMVDTDPLDGSLWECRHVVEPEYTIQAVDGAAESAEDITWREVLDWLMRLPAPPPGFSPTVWQALGPALCGLSADSWGCGATAGNPVTPGQPGGDR